MVATAVVVSVTMGVMKPVLDKLATLMGHEYKKLKGLRKRVTFLQRELSNMDALLEKMDSADELDPQAKIWRRDIIDMTYKIEDYIDDFMHRIGEDDKKTGKLRKACKFLRTFMDRRRLADEFQQIKTQVMEASETRKRYNLDQCILVTPPIAVDPRMSALYKDTTSLVGIDAQKDKLVGWAMDEEQQLKVMSIVGFGGLGKTTLANEVHREVGEHFNCKAIVCVSQTPDVTKLLNGVLLWIGLGPLSHVTDMDLINKIREHLEDKRYFIVVDDLWDTRAWDTIQCAFPKNNMFSRVIITTREYNVADHCCGDNGRWVHTMMPLSDLDSRKLFFIRIFGSEDDCPPEFMEPSCTILKKCGGLPLAIITVASMLACHRTRLEGQWVWESILQSLATNFATKSKYEDMMYVLDLSYRYLPRQLKACFLYLGSYPEDHEIQRVELVRRWVAEGFVSKTVGEDVWDVAESYFNELVNRSMIQPIYKEYVLGVYGCRVHDMLLALIAKRCEEDNFLCLVNSGPHVVVNLQEQDKVIRRLTIVGFEGAEDDEVARITIGNLSQIRSLAMMRVSNWMPSLREFKSIRVLFLEIKNMEIDLTNINQLSQLRYLSIRGFLRRKSPHLQIKRLQLLQTLDLSRFDLADRIEIADAPCLSHLIMPHYTVLFGWIGRFKLLRTLRVFNLPTDSLLESIKGLGELTCLSDLVLKSPRWCTPLVEAAWMAALGASLEKLRNLRQIDVIILNSFDSNKNVAWCADALTSLSPPFHNLELLGLGKWTFSRVPRWIGCLRKLRELWIGAKQILQEDVTVIGTELPDLIMLGLRIAPGIPVEKLVIAGSTGFPAVERFWFDCDRMSCLTFEEGAMPQLRELQLIFAVDGWEKVAPCGLHHLPRLEEIIAVEGVDRFYTLTSGLFTSHDDARPAMAAVIRGVFQEPVDALPTRPAFTWTPGGGRARPREEEYFRQHGAVADPRFVTLVKEIK